MGAVPHVRRQRQRRPGADRERHGCAALSQRRTGRREPIAKAFVYRAHSGSFGIVNSEEAYQNLTRFLFGDIRVDVWVDIDDVTPARAD